MPYDEGLAILAALAFLGGAVERAMSLACLMVGGMHTMASHTGHEHHPPSKEQGPAKNHEMKCFLYCISGFNVLPPNTTDDIALQTASTFFSPALKALSGRPVVLDPGIAYRLSLCPIFRGNDVA
jgi:hypothetical protein